MGLAKGICIANRRGRLDASELRGSVSQAHDEHAEDAVVAQPLALALYRGDSSASAAVC